MPNYLPKRFSTSAISLYIAVLVVCNLYFFSHMLEPMWWLFGIIEVYFFFYYSNLMTRRWAEISPKLFVKKLFQTSLIIRIVWVIFSYYFYMSMTGQPFEFDTADAFNYHNRAIWIRSLIETGNGAAYSDFLNEGVSDAGYASYLGVIYLLTNNSIFIARLLKAFMSAYICVLIYRLGTRNFGEVSGRMGAIFCMLMPNLILYTGLHLKEVEMIFLMIWFLERADFLFRSRKYNFTNISIPLLLAGSLFFFRTVLGATALIAMITALVFSSSEVMSLGKRFVLFLWVAMVSIYFIGGRISLEVETILENRENSQEQSLDFRSKREGGNSFAKYAGGAVFVPMIFVIPYPTIVATPKQENIKLINGGNFVKNIMAFFVFLAFYWILKKKEWRNTVLLSSFIIGYLAVIAFSSFAQSERFHQPVLALELLFAAYGISVISNKQKKYFTWWMALIFLAIIGWSWFKLAGRGLV